MSRLTARVFVALLSMIIGGCSDSSDSSLPLVLSVKLPNNSSQSLRIAASDLEVAAREISGASQSQDATHRILISLEPDAQRLTNQGYGLKSANGGLVVRARDEIGAMYGLYDLAARLGARYIHPEQTIYPLNPKIQLPELSQERVESPHYRWRGFHEHTQHPTVMSDYLLRPDRDEFRTGVSNYLRWLVRPPECADLSFTQYGRSRDMGTLHDGYRCRSADLRNSCWVHYRICRPTTERLSDG